ncbi:MAG: O-antigen translocase [Candidatus Acidiferrales bacterium]
MATVPCSNELDVSSLESLPQPATATRPRQQSYGQILKSSALVGGSSVLNIGIGIVRTKAMAMLLGPAGFGLFGLYGSIVDLTQAVAGMGINSSGVRQIAEAVGSGKTDRIGLTVALLRRTSIVLGALGSVLLIAFSRQVSSLTFGSPAHAAAISLLSIAVLLRLVSAGQTALIQGMRRISDLAKISVLGALFGTIITILVVYFLREKGIVPSLVAIAAMTIGTSWWYSRKVDLQIPAVTLSQVSQETAALLKLGFAFMASGLMTMGVAYATRIIVLRSVGFDATGLYQSAWTLGGLYVGFILQAMGADFYPRLTANAKDNAACNRLVNEQAQIGLLLAGPGVIATLTFAPLVVALFYSAKFAAAVGILRWICLGVTLQVITWPMGFIIIAKGKSIVFFSAELAWTIVAIGLAWGCVKLFGLDGAGIAFFGAYIFHYFLIYPIVRHLSGFRWSTNNRWTILFFVSLIAALFCALSVLKPIPASGVGTLAAILSCIYSIRILLKLVPLDRLPRPALQLLTILGVPLTTFERRATSEGTADLKGVAR